MPIFTCGYLSSKEIGMTNLDMGRSRVTIVHIDAPVFRNVVTYL